MKTNPQHFALVPTRSGDLARIAIAAGIAFGALAGLFVVIAMGLGIE